MCFKDIFLDLLASGFESVGRDWHQRSGEERQIQPARRDNLVSNPGILISCFDGQFRKEILSYLGPRGW